MRRIFARPGATARLLALLAGRPGQARRLSRRLRRPGQRAADAVRNGGQPERLDQAVALADEILARFADPQRGGFSSPPRTASRSWSAARTQSTIRSPAATAWRRRCSHGCRPSPTARTIAPQPKGRSAPACRGSSRSPPARSSCCWRRSCRVVSYRLRYQSSQSRASVLIGRPVSFRLEHAHDQRSHSLRI